MSAAVQRRRYETDSYAQDSSARVLEIHGRRVILDDTPLLPEYAGVEGDLGSIDGRAVLYSLFVDNGRVAAHGLDSVSGLRPGARVRVQVDFHRRMGLMKNATAADLVLGVLIRDPRAAPVTDIAITERGSTFEFGRPWRVDLNEITRVVSRAIAQALPIQLGTYDAKHRRLCRIPGWPTLVGYGPRVAKTSEVGPVRLAAIPDAASAIRLDCFIRSGAARLEV